MKKIILLLVLFSLNIKVEASTTDVYYSEYSDFSEFVETKIDSSELVDVESERRYRWYKENITSEYLIYDEGISKYESVDLELYKESEFSEWSLEQPIKLTDRTIETKEEYRVSKLKPIGTLIISEFKFSKDIVDLGELEIYVNNKKIDFNIVCGTGADKNFFKSGFMMVDFYEPYYMKSLEIKFVGAEKEYIDGFKIYAVEPMITDIPSNIFASYTYSKINDNDISISEDDFVIVNPKYEEEIIYDLLPNVSSLDSVKVDTKYRYKDKYYYFYNTELEYVDGYYYAYPGYIKDEKDYKDYYRYRTREKIVIENELTITRYKEKLESFIVSTTDYEIESDINYLENGVYSVRYITPFRTIEKEVTVDIEENDLRKELEEVNQRYDDLINDYDFTQKQLEELTKSINTKNYEINKLNEALNQQKLSSDAVKYDELLNNYNLLKGEYQNMVVEDNTDYINSLKSENEKCSNDLTNMSLTNEDYEKKLKLSNQANDYLQQSLLDIKQTSIDINKNSIIPFILIGLIIILSAIIIIKKMSSKN